METNKPLVNTISDNYKILKVLGQGCFGQVVHCLKQDTKENVAVKVLKLRNQQHGNQRELRILKKLRCLDPEKNNIVRCLEWFCKIDRTFMVFEMLDMSILDYMRLTNFAPLPLHGIRTIIQDVVTALSALKGFGLIHTDLKLDNIMLVDHRRQPFRVKLIDFGLTLEKPEVHPGLGVQPLWNRAPEVIVGFPFSEAIDIWSLGTVMAELLLGFPLFPGQYEYQVLSFIIDLLGDLPKRILDRGLNTSTYFNAKHKYFAFLNWELMKPFHYEAVTGHKMVDRRKYRFSSLDDLKTSSQHTANSAEAADRKDCVELLKEMLQMDPKKRITPSEILQHPFILGSYPRPTSLSSIAAWQKQSVSKKNTAETKTNDRTSRTFEPSCRYTMEPPPGVIMVRPAEKTIWREEATKQKSCIRYAIEPTQGVIMVRPAEKAMQELAPKQRSNNGPQAVEDQKTDSSEGKYDSECTLQSISDQTSVYSLTSESDTSSVTTSPSKDSDIQTIFLDSPDTVSTQDSDSTDSDSTDSDSTDSDSEDSDSEDSDSEDSDSEDSDSTESDSTDSDSTNSAVVLEVSEPKKKKEKKGIRRFFSTLKRKLFSFCCISKVDD
ncbi:homeodomain-interacting protein kinase 2-like isoform X2 [Centropristis striata]|uniref:homeodomain-interacting protein kinase 2-like isoform X2 n=1 Tax=Centropristis striata TaxID=184440 RepID=UPI0027DFB37A|nr:homeodomain-interacting protein kinase 2-like isoform X2 [Centropristis striata]